MHCKKKETPSRKWDDVKSTLSKLDTSKLHYVKVPENHIVIDFDIRDETGQKSFQKNLEAAKEWPPTYAELSKSGAGIHLHYIYSGDVTKLSRIYDMVYICDNCGSADLEETDFLFGIPYKHMPDGWISLGKGHLCPTCAEIFLRIAEEVKGEKNE